MCKKVSINDIIYFFLGLYLLFLEIAENSIFYKISLVSLLFAFIISFIRKPKPNFNILLFSIVLYIIYQLILFCFHVPPSNYLFQRDIKSLFYIFIILYIIYNIVVNDGRIDKFLKIYIIVNVLALLIIIFVSKDTLFTQRLSHSYNHQAASFYLFNIPIYMTSNSFSFELAVAFLFSLYFYKKDKNKIYLLFSILFVLGVLLTGSRKGFVVLIIFIIWWINELNKQKFLKKTIIFSLLITISYVSVMNIPILYNTIGERMVILEKYIFNNEISSDVRNRDNVQKLALEKISSKPLTGYGEGAFKYFYGNITASNSENNYLELMIHGGIIGLLVYYLYLINIAKDLFNNRYKTKITKMMLIIMLSMLIIEFGSVHYNSLKMLLFIILYLANRNIESINLREVDTICLKKLN